MKQALQHPPPSLSQNPSRFLHSISRFHGEAGEGGPRRHRWTPRGREHHPRPPEVTTPLQIATTLPTLRCRQSALSVSTSRRATWAPAASPEVTRESRPATLPSVVSNSLPSDISVLQG